MKFKMFIAISLVLILMGCEKSYKTYYDQKYIETIRTSKGDIMVFTDEDGQKNGFIISSDKTFKVVKNKLYDVDISLETISQHEGFVQQLSEVKSK
ncbi:hypothetical protein G7L40_20445 [Paenibacillus polymyxa]|uniref:Uncharacterized protein n=1 Tax=Paenibacillus polymyxa TaxID=1406 RepID=A0A378XZG4_PAEPO|nr:hypothetical protein [Paenibacillus polymyxa]MBE7896140.1 hypothetical protein [Paenibacillus polymyxa]MBG9765914.1 hypothetical protein [Paenibacillus polymyxa]MCC3256670.1 hypothetical protein [Paenibacillus polymyxa]QPK54839.1 hypothetical protein G7035_20490 [Paenibacillus polymyxa]QPK59929.1 hypothetical protein G7L40_20445 [Paenibacillus polymyxa]